ncbi:MULTISPECIES: peptidylprolyl isomerase [unclassified Sphingomonas]|uniref:peptidylprolyl isomerase n=1 Tax=unclassified Sphingomonas TaxID=196159 RepID=UPI0009269135|nr:MULTISPECIES: peptidylprolyl isomerase [unclassified Sphingomonas]MBN8849080.1 peptidylprolyl isomerase [Sphingomonas sp.]OJV29355.1 MAG: peptidylprolyl isomerase [Sphingomonas sp. 67-36]
MRFIGVVAIIGALVATPALAKKEKKDTVVQTEAPAVRAAPPALDDRTNQWLLDLSDGGRVTILLRPDAAPLMVDRIKTLTRQHFYDGLTFHRVIDGFMAQGGDPKGDGTGGSTLPDIKAEFNYLPHVRGAVAAARAQSEDSANSQFYIVFQPRLSLDHKYTVFGRVIEGMQYVDGIERGEPPANPTRIIHAYIASDNPPAYQAAPPPAVNAGAVLGPVTLPGAGKPTAPAPAKAPPRPKKP